ncbi:DASS family sodium-coupled anion symporter [Lactobacillus sp. DCY120]|uniref:DASS family sodium-coupled anion symporter n=1 Tax=Bombilactobacillus apium TaxID=2675299 RepID=A0A850R839_9LACO|nr:DASS family sodium-coupled anion symporter [Bombilactobacillus apium]NVY97017.1 DASS family sodium-coupled anion symporter [Bombilactobacillus apium]
MTKKAIQFGKVGLLILIPAIIWFLPVPAGVASSGWHTLAIFVGFIIGCLLSIAPLAVLGLIALASLAITNTIPPVTLYGGFGNSAIWLIMFAFFMAIGFRTTNLGSRLAYFLIARFGRSSLSLAYTLTACDLIMAPFVPNTNARGAGIMYPITMSLAKALGSDPQDHTEGKIGSFLILTSFHTNLLAGALFFTAMATNPLAMALAKPVFHINVSWGSWFLYACVPVIAALILVPLVIYSQNRPELVKIPAAQKFAREQLQAMGKISTSELMMTAIFLLTIIGWSTSKWTHLDNTAIAGSGLVLLIISQVIKIDDVLEEKKVWDIFLWLPIIMAMTTYLVQTKVVKWFQILIADSVQGLNLSVAFLILMLVYLYIHYFFTSVLVHLQVFFLPFATVLVSMGANPLVTVMLLALLTCVSPATTHYGTGTGSIYFATGYTTQKDWWRVGFEVSVVEFILFAGLGLLWWKLLGLY